MLFFFVYLWHKIIGICNSGVGKNETSCIYLCTDKKGGFYGFC